MSEASLRQFLRSIQEILHGPRDQQQPGEKEFYSAQLAVLGRSLGKRRGECSTLLDDPQLRLDCNQPIPPPPADDEPPPAPPDTPLPSERLAASAELQQAKNLDEVKAVWDRLRKDFGPEEKKLLDGLVNHAKDGPSWIAMVRVVEGSMCAARPTPPQQPLVILPSRGATAADWSELAATIRGAVKDQSICELARLIYIYWHEEAGAYWAVERLADRFENGIHADTLPLRSLHLEERVPGSTNASALLAAYIGLRRRDSLSMLSERWKQYLMQYGFAPGIARAWPVLDVADARARFAPALHTWLHEALVFYRRLENLQINPDVTAAKASAEELSRQIAEGGENLGDQPYAAGLRPEIQLTKVILGHPQIHGKLGIRPGTGTLMAPWEQSLDAIAERYRWPRKSTEHYRQLAEHGELLLVILSLVQPLSSLSEGAYRAFLDLIKDLVMRYAIAYHMVTGVDLRAQADPRSPIETMSALLPPKVPPLRGPWTDQRASALAAAAAAAW